MRYTPRPVRSYTDAENDGFWPDGECAGFDVEVTDDQPTGVLDSRGDMLWRSRPQCGFVLSKK